MAEALEVLEIVEYSLNKPPLITQILNLQKNLDLRCLNYIYQVKSKGKFSWSFLCPHCKGTKKGSISVKADDNGPLIPIIATYLQLHHNHDPLTEESFYEKEFIDQVKQSVLDNPLIPIQQLFDRKRVRIPCLFKEY